MVSLSEYSLGLSLLTETDLFSSKVEGEKSMGLFKNTVYNGGAEQADPDFQTYRETFAKKPVLVMCDMNYIHYLPCMELPACIKITMEVYVDENRPDLISGAEMSHLSDLRSILRQHIGGRFVGQGIIASQSMAFLMFYCTDHQAKAAKRMLQETFLGSFRQSEVQVVYDPEGNEYKKFLYPKPVKQRQISNAKMARKLSGYGDDGTKPRNITFHMVFTSRTSAMDFFSKASLHGFQYQNLEKEPAPEGMVLPRFHLTISKIMPFTVDLLEVVDAYLLEQAEQYEAVYKNIETDILSEE